MGWLVPHWVAVVAPKENGGKGNELSEGNKT